MTEQVESAEELRRLVIEEFNRKIEKLRILGFHWQANKLEKWKRVFQQRNFTVDENGTVRFC